MPSNKLSGRRSTALKPAICVSKLPPIVPPPPWPGTVFSVQLEFSAPGGMPPFSFDKTWDLTWDSVMAWWNGRLDQMPNYYDGWWSLNHVLQTGDLQFSGEHDATFWQCQKNAIPVNWGAPAAYTVIAWDFIDPPGSTATARFTF